MRRLVDLRVPSRRMAAGWMVTLVGIAVATAALVPFRAHITVATAALVLVIPVALGVAVGGFAAVPVGVAVGFLTFDFVFIPPYYTFYVSAWEDWVSLLVFACVGCTVGSVVAQLARARREAEERQTETQVLFELSQSLAVGPGVEEDLPRILERLRALLGSETVAVFLTGQDGELHMVASAGRSRPEPETYRTALDGLSSGVDHVPGAPAVTRATLSSPRGRLGVLVALGPPLGPSRQRFLGTFANQAALGIERGRLAEEANRARVLEEVDRLRSALMGSVSHDLRTPLASIKASISDLADPDVTFSHEDRMTLLRTTEEETDRLGRLVSNLLDMSRIQAGALDLHRAATPLDELVGAVASRMAPVLTGHPVQLATADDLPLLDVDYLLVEQVITNLLENAARYGPAGTAVTVSARRDRPGWIQVRVADRGPGVAESERMRIFDQFYRLRLDGTEAVGTGMGLAICKGVVEAHGGAIWVETTPGGGATFVFRLPAVTTDQVPEELDPKPSFQA